MLRRGVIVLSSLLLTTTGVFTSSANAQVGTAITVGPAVLDMSAHKGETDTQQINVSNNSDETLNISISQQSLVTTDRKLPDTYREALDASGWLSTTPNQFTLSPKQSQAVEVVLTVPADAEPGGRYASIIVQPKPASPSSTTKSGADILGSVNASVLATVAGTVNTQLSATGPLVVDKVVTKSPMAFAFTLKNTGNVHTLATQVDVVLLNRSGKISQRLHAPADQLATVILPGESKHYVLTTKDLPATGWYNAQAQVTYGASGGTKTLQLTSNRFFVLPVAVLITAGLVLLLIVASIFAGISRRRRRKRFTPTLDMPA